MEFKSQVGPSFGNNFNNRSEEAIGSATDIWVAYREGRFGKTPAPFLGYFFLLQDCDRVKAPVRNKEPYFNVDPVFDGASYSKRYELLCRRLVLERVYSAACLVMATNAKRTKITQPAEDLSFQRFVAALRGHVVTFLGSR
jgi:Restriction endonuclease XhoI